MTTTTTLPNPIKVSYWSIDGFRQSRSFKTLAGARKFAQKWVGVAPDTSGWYAVSFDGVGRITANVPMDVLFGSEAAAA